MEVTLFEASSYRRPCQYRGGIFIVELKGLSRVGIIKFKDVIL